MDGLATINQAPGAGASRISRHYRARHALRGQADALEHHRRRPDVEGPSATRSSQAGPSSLTEVEASYRRKDKTSLSIRTADGDVVKLQFKSVSSTQFSASTYEAGDATSSEFELHTRQRTKISMSVRGELDADELAANQETIAQAGEITSDFFNGDMAAAFEQAADLGIRSDEIASVRLRLKSNERLTYSASAQVSRPADTRPALPSDTSSAIDPAVSATIPPVHEVDIAGTTVDMAGTEVDIAGAKDDGASTPTTDALAHAPADAPTRFDALGPLSDFLDSLLEGASMGEQPDASGTGATVAGTISMSLKLRIFESVLVTAYPTERPAEPLPQILSETIDDIVAQRQPPMEALA